MFLPRFGKFSFIISLNKLSATLSFFPFGISIILMFVHLMEFHRSHSSLCSFSCFFGSPVFWLFQIFYLLDHFLYLTFGLVG